MRISAILFAATLAAATSTNAFADEDGGHHRHHHHHHHHHHHVPVPSEWDMRALGAAGLLSLFTPIPITIYVTHTADEAGRVRLHWMKRHGGGGGGD